MGAIGDRVTVTDAATLIAVAGRFLRIKNASATNAVDLGGANVTSGGGYVLAVGDEIEVDASVDELYGICGAALTSEVQVLAVRR